MESHFSFPDYDTFRYHHFFDESPSPSDFSRHCHDFFELIFVEQGTGKYIVEGTQYYMEPGTLLLLRPRTFHYVEINAGAPYERHVFHFSPHALSGEAVHLLDRFDQRTPSEGNFYTAEGVPAAVAELIRNFDSVSALSDEEGVLLAKLRISELLLLLSGASAYSGERLDDRLGAKVLHYLNENLREQVRLDELAKRFFVSKYYLCRAFKEQNGISIHGYLNRKRIILAKQLIDGGETAARAAYRVGFGDYSSFFRAYKKMIGRAPSEK
jgi:AraC-like DNA-binding protein